MLACLGDLIDDVVVRVHHEIRHASDTAATISRRQGGSAANVAVSGAQSGASVRFLGQVGDDTIGHALVEEIKARGVDVQHVAMRGDTGTIVVVVDGAGERTMLTDRRACVALAEPQPCWLDGVTVLHVPLYSLTEGSLAETASTLINWAHDRAIAVSIDASSSAVIEAIGRRTVLNMIGSLSPAVLFANDSEAGALTIDAAIGSSMVIVKRGSEPATIWTPDGHEITVPAHDIGPVSDTTGAGDAFAAGFLTYRNAQPPTDAAAGVLDWQTDPEPATRRGHAVAAKLLASR